MISIYKLRHEHDGSGDDKAGSGADESHVTLRFRQDSTTGTLIAQTLLLTFPIPSILNFFFKFLNCLIFAALWVPKSFK